MRGGTLGSGAGADGTMDPESVTDPGVLRVSPLDGAGRSACVVQFCSWPIDPTRYTLTMPDLVWNNILGLN